MELLAPIRGARRVFCISQGCLFEEINNQNGVKPLRDHVPLEPLGPDGREPSILSDPTNIRTGVLAVASPAGKSKLCIIIHWPFKKWNTSDFKCKTYVCMYVCKYVCMYIYIYIYNCSFLSQIYVTFSPQCDPLRKLVLPWMQPGRWMVTVNV